MDFNWKSLFINEESKNEAANKAVPNDTKSTQFPEQNTKMPEVSTISQTAHIGSVTNNPFLNEIIDVYQKGFDGLNHQGFDFFELYKSVSAVGITNPQSYQMAFTMGKTINPSLSKDFLLEKAKYYISEIEKVHANYSSAGESKRSDIDNAVKLEKSTLTTEINNLEAQIAELQKRLSEKKLQLDRVDTKNIEQFSEINLKIDANNLAKQRILDSINTVVSGINQYL